MTNRDEGRTHERHDGVAMPMHVELDGIDPHVYARRWQTLAVLCASLIIVIVGNTVLNVALPTLQHATSEGGLGASNTQIQWIVDAYALGVRRPAVHRGGARRPLRPQGRACRPGSSIFGLGSLHRRARRQLSRC